MKIDTNRASKKLGVSKAVVRKMCDGGLLKDYGATKAGDTRHNYVLDRDEVAQFAATHVRQGRVWIETAAAVTAAKPKRAYTRKVTMAPAQPAVVTEPERKVTNGEGLVQRLERIEKFLFG